METGFAPTSEMLRENALYLLFDWDFPARDRGLIEQGRGAPQRLVGKYINLRTGDPNVRGIGLDCEMINE